MLVVLYFLEVFIQMSDEHRRRRGFGAILSVPLLTCLSYSALLAQIPTPGNLPEGAKLLLREKYDRQSPLDSRLHCEGKGGCPCAGTGAFNQGPMSYTQFKDVRATATSKPIDRIARMNGLEEDWTLVVNYDVGRSISARGAKWGPWGGNSAPGTSVLLSVSFLKQKGIWTMSGYSSETLQGFGAVYVATACTAMPGDDPASPTGKAAAGSADSRAIREAVIDYVSNAGGGGLRPNLAGIYIEVTNITFEKDQAQATVSFGVKNDPDPLVMKYALERSGGKWVVKR